MTDSTTTLTGNLTRDIELRYSEKGNAFARGGIAVNYRRRNGDDWEDVPSFFDFSILDGQMAENATETLSKGDRVIITGRLEQRTVETDDGDKRSYVSLIVDNIGPSLRWATASIVKNPKGDRTPANAGAARGDDFFDQ